MHKVSRVDTAICEVGEGAHWDDRQQALLYLDIVGRKVHRYDPLAGTTHSWDTPGNTGAMALRESGEGVVLGMTDCFALLDFQTGTVERIADFGAQVGGAINDGKADTNGRFVVGRCGPTIENPQPTGGVFALTAPQRVAKLESGIHLSNSVCFAADGRTLYFGDSHTYEFFACDYDPETGEVANKRLLIDTRPLGGMPDGATLDSDGLIWMAIFGAGRIAAFRPDGTVERTIDVPVKLVSSVAFGGRRLDQLYVTSLDPRSFGAGEPDENGGAVYLVEGLGSCGILEPRYAG
jgi:sugar lactone lactonase YvrE